MCLHLQPVSVIIVIVYDIVYDVYDFVYDIVYYTVYDIVSSNIVYIYQTTPILNTVISLLLY